MRIVLLVMFLTLASAWSAVIVTEKVSAPGATGLVTNVDFDNMKPTDAGFLLNVDVDYQRGVLSKRSGLIRLSASAIFRTSEAFPLYDERKNRKNFIIFAARVSSGKTIWTFGTYRRGSNGSLYADSVIGWDTLQLAHPIYSPNFAVTTSGNDTIVWPVNYLPIYQNWAEAEGYVVYADGHSPPASFSIMNVFTDSNASFATDTFGFAPNAAPLSLEPPGALRPFAINDTVTFPNAIDGAGTLTGVFQYAVSFFHPDSSTRASYEDKVISPMGPSSIEVNVKNGSIALTCFPIYPHKVLRNDGQDTTFVRIYRRSVTKDGPWLVLDSICYELGATVWYLDTIPDNLTTVIADTILDDYTNAIATPGAGWFYEGDTIPVLFSARTWEHDSAYYFRYSYYDPVREIESPLGPPVKITSPASDSLISIFRFPISNWHEHAKRIRLYTTVTQDGLIGGNDTSIFYLWAEIDLDSLNMITDESILDSNGIWIGAANDSSIVDGLHEISQFAEAGIGSYFVNSSEEALTRLKPGFPWVEVITDNIQQSKFTAILSLEGVGVMRPPFISQMFPMLSDFAFANQRLWGIGDAIFPSRVYYSNFQSYGDWPALNFFTLDEGDGQIIIDVERISVGGVDALLVFKTNKMFLLTGEDAEFDLQVIRITDNIGLATSELMVNYKNVIYFVDQNARMYRTNGGMPEDISASVRSQLISVLLDSMDINSSAARTYIPDTPADFIMRNNRARMMVFNDEVLVMNVDDSRALAWNTNTGLWAMREYSINIAPRGVLRYDTVLSISERGISRDLFFYEKANARLFYIEQDRGQDESTPFVTSYRKDGLGDDYNLWQLQQIDFTISGTCSLLVTVRDEQGDSLAATIFKITSSGTPTGYRVGLPRHIGKNLSFELQDIATTTRWQLHGYTTHMRNMGVARVQ